MGAAKFFPVLLLIPVLIGASAAAEEAPASGHTISVVVGFSPGGAYDLYARIQDPIELAEDAKAAGMRAICIKRHNFPTAGIAALTRKVVPDFDVFGSLACNRQVGGVNPSAVEAAIKYGIRQLWQKTGGALLRP